MDRDLRAQTNDSELDLHDGVLQALYGVGLKLEYCIALVDESPEQAKAGLDAAITSLGEVIATIRHRLIDPLKDGVDGHH